MMNTELRSAYDAANQYLAQLRGTIVTPFSQTVADSVFAACTSAMQDHATGSAQYRVVPAPTGSGKSSCALAFIKALIDTTPDSSILYLVETRKHAEDVYKDMIRLLGSKRVAVWTRAHDAKILPEEALKKYGLSRLKKAFSEVASCHARGVNQIKNIVPTLELAKRKCWIISDGDAPAKAAQEEHIEARSHGTWLRYDQFGIAAPPNVTAEDFIKQSAYKAIADQYRAAHKSLGALSFKNHDAKLKTLETWLHPAFADKKAKQTEIGKIKDQIFDNLTSTDIEPAYFALLEKLAEAIA